MINSENIPAKDQQEYQLGVGMLLYLVKHLYPDLANVIRELLKANDCMNPAAYGELLHVIKYVFNKKNLGLKIVPMGNFNKPWEIVCLAITTMQETR